MESQLPFSAVGVLRTCGDGLAVFVEENWVRLLGYDITEDKNPDEQQHYESKKIEQGRSLPALRGYFYSKVIPV